MEALINAVFSATISLSISTTLIISQEKLVKKTQNLLIIIISSCCVSFAIGLIREIINAFARIGFGWKNFLAQFAGCVVSGGIMLVGIGLRFIIRREYKKLLKRRKKTDKIKINKSKILKRKATQDNQAIQQSQVQQEKAVPDNQV